jgi:nitrate reductase gamma subunit
MHFALQPSRVFTSLLFSSHALTLIALWLTHWNNVLTQAGFTLLTLWSLLRTRNHPALQRHTELTLEPEQHITLTLNGEQYSGTVTAHTVIAPYLVLLGVKLTGKRRAITLPIFYDALPHDLFRTLRVRLKFAP